MSHDGYTTIDKYKEKNKSVETKSRSFKSKRNRLKKTRILIIQERDMVRELLSQILFIKGCRVDTAISLLEGIRKMKRKKFDLVITDTATSEWNECDFMKRNKEINEKIYWVILDGGDNQSGFRRVNDPDLHLVIQKPFDINKIIKKIDGLLNAGI
ncbi:MAG: response regulator [Deltaproteobacteria bacterium]|nr:response regulator [Deltaproteobacteria bacterium]